MKRTADGRRLDAPVRPAGGFARPAQGRLFVGRRVVRMADVTPAGRLRLDALARYLGEVAEEDVADAGWDDRIGWVVRRSELRVDHYPAFGDSIELATYCSGVASRWAERTTVVVDGGGDALEARALWVAVDPEGGRPQKLGPSFGAVYGPSAGGHRPSARLELAGPPADLVVRPWPLRAVDLDLWAHANNAVHWAAVEELLAAGPSAPRRATVEYNEPVRAGARLGLGERAEGPARDVWLFDGRRRVTSIRLEH